MNNYIKLLTPNRRRVMVFARAQSAFERPELADVRPIRPGEEDLPVYGETRHIEPATDRRGLEWRKRQ